MQHYRTIFLLMAFVVLLSGCAAQRQTAMTSSEHHVSPIFNVADTNSFFSALRFGMTRDDFDRLVREHQSNGLLINEVAMPASDYRHPLNPLSSSGILCSFDDTRHLRLPGSGIYAFFFYAVTSVVVGASENPLLDPGDGGARPRRDACRTPMVAGVSLCALLIKSDDHAA